MQAKTFSLTYTETAVAQNNSAETPVTGAVVVAAGSASRMGGTNKILAPLLGLPVIWRTLAAFQRHPGVADIVVVTREDMIPDLQQIVERGGFGKVTDIVVGGNCREESVKHGFERLTQNKTIKSVLIHDGARPLISAEVIDRVITATEEFAAAIPVVPLNDTVKKVGTLGRVEYTPKRADLVAVQTPQGFSVEVYQTALSKLNGAFEHTDDSSIAEAAGIDVYTVLGDVKNIKITMPEDLILAEAYLKTMEDEA